MRTPAASAIQSKMLMGISSHRMSLSMVAMLPPYACRRCFVSDAIPCSLPPAMRHRYREARNATLRRSRGRASPQFPRGDAGALGERFQLRPHDGFVHAPDVRRLGETAIGAGHDVVAADQPGDAHQPL